MFYRAARRAGLLSAMDPGLYDHPERPPDARLRIQYLGTAGFVVEADGQTLVIDPYVSRPSGRQTLLGALWPDVERIRRYIPRADHVLVGHAHHDHVLDAPEVCRQTGAKLVGSVDVCNVGRAAGLPEHQLIQTKGRQWLDLDGVVARGLPSQHGRVFFNRVGLPGYIPTPPPWPPKVTDLRHGHVLNWYLEIGGQRIVHIDTAEFFESTMHDLECDVLCLCAIGRTWRPNYVKQAIELLKPKVVLPCHWDLFTTPIEHQPYLLPEVDLPGFIHEIQDAGAESVVLPFFGEYWR
jgi:L-ascorbate metabolism protein UlaG (beta-lactamase superfamily)